MCTPQAVRLPDLMAVRQNSFTHASALRDGVSSESTAIYTMPTLFFSPFARRKVLIFSSSSLCTI
jgi:hypothetical protein